MYTLEHTGLVKDGLHSRVCIALKKKYLVHIEKNDNTTYSNSLPYFTRINPQCSLSQFEPFFPYRQKRIIFSSHSALPIYLLRPLRSLKPNRRRCRRSPLRGSGVSGAGVPEAEIAPRDPGLSRGSPIET
jgi:hypothetical protein